MCIMSTRQKPKANSEIRLLNNKEHLSAEALDEGELFSREHRSRWHNSDTEWKSKRTEGGVVYGRQYAANR